MALTTAEAWRNYQAANVRARHAYRTDPFAGTRELNRTDQAQARMAARRAAKKEKS